MEIAPHGATRSQPIIHLKDFFISVDHEVVIYALPLRIRWTTTA